MTTDPAQVARPDSLIPEPTRSPDDHGLRAYLVADIRGYTAFTHDRGDEAASVLVQRFVDTAASAVRAHRGRIVATWGDGLGERSDPGRMPERQLELAAGRPRGRRPDCGQATESVAGSMHP